MKKKRRIENRIIAVILCMAILFSQVNIADAADLNPSGTNTSQVVLTINFLHSFSVNSF